MKRKETQFALAALAAGSPRSGSPRRRRKRHEPPEGDGPATCEHQVDGSAPRMVVCDAGGDGAQSCETHTTVSVSGIGYVSGCGVTCDDGNYACCHEATMFQKATCSCQSYRREARTRRTSHDRPAFLLSAVFHDRSRGRLWPVASALDTGASGPASTRSMPPTWWRARAGARMRPTASSRAEWCSISPVQAAGSAASRVTTPAAPVTADASASWITKKCGPCTPRRRGRDPCHEAGGHALANDRVSRGAGRRNAGTRRRGGSPHTRRRARRRCAARHARFPRRRCRNASRDGTRRGPPQDSLRSRLPRHGRGRPSTTDAPRASARPVRVLGAARGGAPATPSGLPRPGGGEAVRPVARCRHRRRAVVRPREIRS